MIYRVSHKTIAYAIILMPLSCTQMASLHTVDPGQQIARHVAHNMSIMAQIYVELFVKACTDKCTHRQIQ